MSEIDEGLRELCLLATMGISALAAGYYFGPIAMCLLVAVESAIASRISDGRDNGGFGLIFIMSLYLAICLGVIWLMLKVNGA